MSKAAPPSTPSGTSHYLHPREEWLALYDEPALEPDLLIIDPHHHLWEREDWVYMLPDLLVDTNSGHNIIGTVFVQCRAMHRAATRLRASGTPSGRSVPSSFSTMRPSRVFV